MKKQITVTTTKTIDLDIQDALLSNENILEFESCIFQLQPNRNKISQLFEYTAELISKDYFNIEGLSSASNINDKTKTDIKFNIIDEYTESYIEN